MTVYDYPDLVVLVDVRILDFSMSIGFVGDPEIFAIDWCNDDDDLVVVKLFRYTTFLLH